MNGMTAVDRVDVANMTRERFRSEYLARARPVVIVDGAAAWKARRWTFEHLKQVGGDQQVVITHSLVPVFHQDAERLGMSFAEAVDTIVSRRDGTYYYLVQQSLAAVLSELLQDIPRPELLDDDTTIALTNLWFGSDGCITPLHHDRADNFLVQILGTKRVTLFSPEETARLYPDEGGARHVSRVNVFDPDLGRFPLYAEAVGRGLVAALNPGDMLFIPKRWWHAVETVSTSVSVNSWWRTAEDTAFEARALAAATCCGAELVTTDAEGAKAFYGALFGWRFDDATGIGPEGIEVRPRTPHDGISDAPQWVPFFSVDDLAGTIAKAEARGGRRVLDAVDAEGRRQRTILTDVGGAAIGIVERGAQKGDPATADLPIVVVDLMASAPEQESFYVETLDCEVSFKLAATPKGPYAMLARSGIVIGGIIPTPKALPGRTHWFPYFRVADCDASTATAVSLGATTIVPSSPAANFRFSILQDPQGSIFALRSG